MWLEIVELEVVDEEFAEWVFAGLAADSFGSQVAGLEAAVVD